MLPLVPEGDRFTVCPVSLTVYPPKYLIKLIGMPRFELRPLPSKGSMLPNYIHIPI